MFQGLAFAIAWGTCLYLQFSPKPWISSANSLAGAWFKDSGHDPFCRIIETRILKILVNSRYEPGSNDQDKTSFKPFMSRQIKVVYIVPPGEFIRRGIGVNGAWKVDIIALFQILGVHHASQTQCHRGWNWKAKKRKCYFYKSMHSMVTAGWNWVLKNLFPSPKTIYVLKVS